MKQDDAEHRPPELRAKSGRREARASVGAIEPVDHRQAQTVEHRDDRQQDRVGGRRQPAHCEVGRR